MLSHGGYDYGGAPRCSRCSRPWCSGPVLAPWRAEMRSANVFGCGPLTHRVARSLALRETSWQRDLAGGPRLHYYVPIEQYPRTFGNGLLIRLRSQPKNGGENVRVEWAVRAALGADRTSIVGLILGRGLTPVLIGALAGVVTAAVMSRWIQPLLYRTSALDPWLFLLAVGSMVIVAGAASLWPALMAARVDPGTALRSD